MEPGADQLHILFFPHLAHGHMIPTIDMARQFARRGVKATILSSPLNAPVFYKTIKGDRHLGLEISIHIIKFPSVEAGLPEGCENLASTTSPEMFNNFYKALSWLQHPLEQILEECRPNCLVADVMFPWATEVAGKFGIPRLIFHGTSHFSLCVFHSLRQYETHKNVVSDFESFTVPGLPHQIKMTKLQQPNYFRGVEDEQTKLTNLAIQSELKSYGVLVNSYYELEPAYSEHYRKVIGVKAWNVGPVSLCNVDIESKALRGNTASIDAHECLRWLDLKQPNSVLYVCFGSKFCFPDAQILEIVNALEAGGQQFIWVMKDEERQEMLEGFERRMEGKGLIIKGWAPQMLILDHEAVGGFLTHCGWNSILEGVSNGVPMITMPLYAEQFYNEKLVTDVLKIGVSVGAQECTRSIDAKKFSLKKGDIENALNRLMVGEEAEEMRSRAQVLKEMARKAVEEGGSSDSDINALLQELRLNCF
ncbi:Glycosyltransferase [Melia azedarach]|uniref:Glycosyltransferase n=1 Tax=Melia azedarach TaxID=155640 RepID=A0ACC1XXY0_MELAZ|nr:Glycosyltransferase [Melia azedarach]